MVRTLRGRRALDGLYQAQMASMGSPLGRVLGRCEQPPANETERRLVGCVGGLVDRLGAAAAGRRLPLPQGRR